MWKYLMGTSSTNKTPSINLGPLPKQGFNKFPQQLLRDLELQTKNATTTFSENSSMKDHGSLHNLTETFQEMNHDDNKRMTMNMDSPFGFNAHLDRFMGGQSMDKSPERSLDKSVALSEVSFASSCSTGKEKEEKVIEKVKNEKNEKSWKEERGNEVEKHVRILVPASPVPSTTLLSFDPMKSLHPIFEDAVTTSQSRLNNGLAFFGNSQTKGIDQLFPCQTDKIERTESSPTMDLPPGISRMNSRMNFERNRRKNKSCHLCCCTVSLD